jgi:uncharacterized protein with PIN domain
MANEEYQDKLQQQSYIKDQQAVIPGKLPAAPIYGPSRELQIKVGPSMPTVYAQRLTPTDIGELIEENQTLRNRVLERMWACPICNLPFKKYDIAKIREHAQEHNKQMQEAGQCPLCGTSDWAFMSMDQKWEHLQWHMAKNFATAKPDPWQQVQCPACDMDFSMMRPETIIAHCLRHSPSIVQCCGRCGLNKAQCTNEELIHHQQACREAPDRKTGDPVPKFCECCGKDTSTQTRSRELLHSRDCKRHMTIGKTFCTKCGLDITTLDDLQISAHTSRCTTPRGITGQFCGRCATDLSKLDTIGTAGHQQTCQPSKSTASTSDEERPELLEHRKTGPPGNIEPPDRWGTPPETQTIPSDLGKCPIDGCYHKIGTMTREEIFTHLQTHSNIGTQAAGVNVTSFKCPLQDYKGETCNRVLSLENNALDLKYHYVHRGTAAEQKAVQEAGNGREANDPATQGLRDAHKAADASLQTHTGFLAEHQPLPPPKDKPKGNPIKPHTSASPEETSRPPREPSATKSNASAQNEGSNGGSLATNETAKPPEKPSATKPKASAQSEGSNGESLTAEETAKPPEKPSATKPRASAQNEGNGDLTGEETEESEESEESAKPATTAIPPRRTMPPRAAKSAAPSLARSTGPATFGVRQKRRSCYQKVGGKPKRAKKS